MKTLEMIDDFVKGYKEAMAWTEEESIGSDWEYSPESETDIINECLQFYQANASLMSLVSPDFEQHGHDFWLTRNGHGAGFWDRGYKKEIADALTEDSHRCGEAYLLSEDREIAHYESNSKVGTWDKDNQK